MDVSTNNKSRLLLSWYELSEKEKRQFDYLDSDCSNSFVRYKGDVYDLGEFSKWTFNNIWDGYLGDTYFSGIVFRFAKEGDRKDYDRVIVGYYYT